VSGRMLEYLERFLKIVPTLTASGFVLHKTTARGVEVSGIAVAVERNCLFEIASRVDSATTRAAASVSFDSHIKLVLLIAFGRQFFSTRGLVLTEGSVDGKFICLTFGELMFWVELCEGPFDFSRESNSLKESCRFFDDLVP